MSSITWDTSGTLLNSPALAGKRPPPLTGGAFTTGLQAAMATKHADKTAAFKSSILTLPADVSAQAMNGILAE